MKKTYILDTNVLVHDPQSIFNFQDNDVVVPILVLEELDKLKKMQTEPGKHARACARNLDHLREAGSLFEGIPLPQGGSLRVDMGGDIRKLPENFREDLYDNRILALVYEYQERYAQEQPVVLVTKDINLRIKSDALGVVSQDYTTDKIEHDDLYSGVYTVEVEEEILTQFYTEGEVHMMDVLDVTEHHLYPNQFVTLVSKWNSSRQALTKVDADRHRLVKLSYSENAIWGISAHNREQRYAVELLLNKDIRLVTLVGKAGTGKTLIALAAGLEQVIEEEAYKRLFVARPIMPMGQDIGYLPGDEKQKLRPWVQPIYDNFEFLTENKFEQEDGTKLFEEYENKKWVKVEALTYIRGRSIPNEYMIIDEAQNLTPHEIKTIITRVGDDTKIIFTGDMEQIDHPYLDESTNGLSYVIEKFKEQSIAGHVTLIKGERSALAELASKLL